MIIHGNKQNIKDASEKNVYKIVKIERPPHNKGIRIIYERATYNNKGTIQMESSLYDFISSIGKVYISNLSAMNKLCDANGIIKVTPTELYGVTYQNDMISEIVTIQKAELERRNKSAKWKILKVNAKTGDITLQNGLGEVKTINRFYTTQNTIEYDIGYITNTSELDVLKDIVPLYITIKSEDDEKAIRQFISGIRFMAKTFLQYSFPTVKPNMYWISIPYINNFSHIDIKFINEGMQIEYSSHYLSCDRIIKNVKDVPELLKELEQAYISALKYYKTDYTERQNVYKQNYDKLLKGMQKAYAQIRAGLKEREI